MHGNNYMYSVISISYFCACILYEYVCMCCLKCSTCTCTCIYFLTCSIQSLEEKMAIIAEENDQLQSLKKKMANQKGDFLRKIDALQQEVVTLQTKLKEEGRRQKTKLEVCYYDNYSILYTLYYCAERYM